MEDEVPPPVRTEGEHAFSTAGDRLIGAIHVTGDLD